MNYFDFKFFPASMFSLALLAAAGTAAAADFPARQKLEAQSARAGLGVELLPVLKRVAGPDKETVAQQVLQAFAASTGITTAGSHAVEADEERLSVAGEDGWFLTVYGDGTRISYRNETLLDSRPELALPLEERLSQDQLESLGRGFVSQHLEAFVKIGEGEELVPSFTEFQVQGGGSTEPGGLTEREQVLASTVVFTRTVGGLSVVGPGSKIAVTFANDGTPVALHVDWAEYGATGEMQEVLPVEEILARSDALNGAGDEKLEHIECGYFDLGGRKRDAAAPLQAGCFLQVTVETPIEGGHVLAGIVEAVPAGLEVLADESWPEALKLAGLPIPEGSPEPKTAP